MTEELKQIISDYTHLTQMEFLIKHPFVVIGMCAVFASIMELIWFIQKRKKK